MIGEILIKPAILAFVKIILEKDGNEVKILPLSNDSVRRRIDGMSDDVKAQLVNKLQEREFLIQMDKSTLNGNKTLLISYVRYVEIVVLLKNALL